MSKVEVNTVEPQCGTTLTVGQACGSVRTASNNIQASDGGNLISQCGTTITLGASGDTINLASGASQSGFGRTGTVDWVTDSIKTATFTAASGKGYFCNTGGGAFELDLPAGSAGDIVSLQDYNNTFDSNALTVDPNGSEKINGGQAGAPLTLNTEGLGISFVYIDSTVGWRSVHSNDYASKGSDYIIATGGTITTCGDYKIHTFTGPGTFSVCALSATPACNAGEYVVVAGGGSGATRTDGNCNGGGGAGGFRFAAPTLAPLTYPGKPLAAPAAVTLAVQSYPITVGAGAPAPGTSTSGICGTQGSNSVALCITSTGGGGGGSGASTKSGLPGGSGGGGGGGAPGGTTGGTGNTPPTSPAQGRNGGCAQTSPDHGSAGGGGAICEGTPDSGPVGPSPGGDGAGLPTAFGSNGVPCGSYRYYAGGGGSGGGHPGTPAVGSGGKGGGGAGGSGGNGVSGTDNSGGGGGGGAANPGSGGCVGGAGGSGIVIIRYKYQ